jgi:hypothetical protein
VKTGNLFLLIWILSAGMLFAQDNCATSKKLICVFPVSADTLATGTFGALVGKQLLPKLQAALPINSAIAAQLTQLPVPSATVGIVSLKRKGSEVPTPFDNLGPILIDRPDTVGRGNIFIGWSYQHFNFNSLDTFNLRTLPIAFSVVNPNSPTLTDYGSMVNNVNFKLDQYVGVATVGITRTTDISLIVPTNAVSFVVVSENFKAITFDSAKGTYTTGGPPPGASVKGVGSASGIGDLTLNVKQMVLGQDHNRPAAAIGATFRFPTGDSLDYLGSGAYGGSLYGLVEYRARLSPHMQLGYQWNASSKILEFQQVPNTRLPGGLSYALGADYRINRRLTMNTDILGTQFANVPYFTLQNLPFNPTPPPSSGIGSTYNIVTTPSNTYTTINFSGGLKASLPGHFLLFGNALVQMNNQGLRSDVVPLAGIAYSFRRGQR